jgi:DNA-binding response OmpR family regulator
MAKLKILAVEDDKNISRLIVYNLEKAGFNCTAAMSGEEALAAVDKEEFDLIILDLMLPKIDGLEVCRILKQDKESQKIPVVMLTAKGEEVDRVVGLELGADDYIVKPFSPRELVLRIKAILRRREVKKEEIPGVLTAEGLSVDIERHKVIAQKKEVELTAMEFRLLVTLMERHGRVQSRDRLLEDVWGITSDIDTRTVDTHIKRLRSKLGRAGKFIRTLRNVGYKFEDDNE